MISESELFSLIIILKYYKDRETNFCLDVDSKCAFSLDFWKFSRGRLPIKELLDTISEVNRKMYADIISELKCCGENIFHLEELLSIDFSGKPSEWLCCLGLEVDQRDSHFALELQDGMIRFNELDPSQRIQLSERFNQWIIKNDLLEEKDEEEETIYASELEDTFDVGHNFRLPFPKTEHKMKNFAEKHAIDVPGLCEMKDLLNTIKVEQKGPELVNFLAALLLNDCVSIWDMFIDHFHEITLVTKVKHDGVRSKSVRLLALRLAILLIYFGYEKAASKCLLAAQNLSHLNRDELILGQVLLWRSFLSNEDLPTKAKEDVVVSSNFGRDGSLKCAQLVKLRRLEQHIKSDMSWEKIQDELYSWAHFNVNTRECAHIISICHFIMFKAFAYELYGFRNLSSICAQMVLGMNTLQETEMEQMMELMTLQVGAARIMRRNIKRSYDSLAINASFSKNLDKLANGQTAAVIWAQLSTLSNKIDDIERLIDERKPSEAEALLEEVALDKSNKSIYSNPSYLNMKLDILRARIILIDESSTSSSDTPMNLLRSARSEAVTKQYRGLEAEATFELGKFWLGRGILDKAMNCLKLTEEQFALEHDLFRERTHFLYVLTARLLQFTDHCDGEYGHDLLWMTKELEDLAVEFGARPEPRDKLMQEQTRSLLTVANFVLNRRTKTQPDG